MDFDANEVFYDICLLYIFCVFRSFWCAQLDIRWVNVVRGPHVDHMSVESQSDSSAVELQWTAC